MSKAEAEKIVKKYMIRLLKENYPFTAVYLFGSHATGKAGKWSDIDVAVLSDKMKKNWNKNEEALWKIGVRVDPRIEPIGFSPKDFEDDWNPIAHEIKKTGIRIE